MSDATAIAVINDIYGYMSISDSADETLIESIMTRKTTQFEKYLEVDSIFVADYVEYSDGDNGSLLFVKNQPLNSITQLAIDNDWVWGTDSTVSSTDYRIVDNRYVAYNGVFYEGLQNIRISYNAGYSTIPEDIVEAFIEEVYRTYNRRKEPDVLIKTLQDGSIHLVPSGLMPSTKNVLDKYKRMRSV